jgi:hypothetical protein
MNYTITIVAPSVRFPVSVPFESQTPDIVCSVYQLLALKLGVPVYKLVSNAVLSINGRMVSSTDKFEEGKVVNVVPTWFFLHPELVNYYNYLANAPYQTDLSLRTMAWKRYEKLLG